MSRPLHIAIVGRALGHPVGGVREYARSITKQLLSLESRHRFTLYYADPGMLGTFARSREIYLRASHRFLWDHCVVPRQLRKDHPDVAWFPHNVVSLGAASSAVVTIHDLLYFRNPDFPIREYPLLDRLYMRTFISRSVRLAQRVIAVSNWTASELTRILEVPPSKIRTIHHAAPSHFRRLPSPELDLVRRRYRLERPFFFYAGSLSPRKNPRRLIEALGTIKDRVPHDLVVTGVGQLPEVSLKGVIDEYGLSDRFRRLGWIPERDLVAMYNLAEALVFPSRYEGFGLTPLEAFACDCPVIASSVAALKEVVGDAALIIEPHDASSLAKAMEDVAQNRALRRRLIEKGRVQLTRFSWRRSAQLLLEELELAAG